MPKAIAEHVARYVIRQTAECEKYMLIYYKLHMHVIASILHALCYVSIQIWRGDIHSSHRVRRD
jgi:hypothetical protein